MMRDNHLLRWSCGTHSATIACQGIQHPTAGGGGTKPVEIRVTRRQRLQKWRRTDLPRE